MRFVFRSSIQRETQFNFLNESRKREIALGKNSVQFVILILMKNNGTLVCVFIYIYILIIKPKRYIIIIIIIIFLHGLGRLTCSGIDPLPSFPGTSTISSSSRFVAEGVFRQSGVVRSFQTAETRPQMQTSRKKRSWTTQETMAMRRCRNKSNDLIHGGR